MFYFTQFSCDDVVFGAQCAIYKKKKRNRICLRTHKHCSTHGVLVCAQQKYFTLSLWFMVALNKCGLRRFYDVIRSGKK